MKLTYSLAPIILESKPSGRADSGHPRWAPLFRASTLAQETLLLDYQTKQSASKKISEEVAK